ncbi:MAG TPA: PKD domain-containing protein, partial [Gemmatimonadales bacterium]|nr:PKD domain-containing protein [Gemmatimonadales bacterium]
MRKLFAVLTLWAGVVSCHLDKLLNSEKPPPSQAPPARVAFASSLSSARAGEPISPPVQVTVQDSTGRVTLRDTLVTLSLGANPGSDKLRGDTVAHSVNGVATFANLRLDKAASGYTLTAAAPELHPDTSGAFSVMPAPATELAFTAQPSATMQDSAIKPPVRVTAYDSLGNVATNFAGPVRVALGTDGSVSKNATLSGAPNPATAVAGVATFPGSHIDQAGVGYTLTAAFGSAAPAATSAGFDITAGPPPPPPPPTHLGFTQQPQTTQAGATITPPVQVAALDAAEHVVQGFTGAIGLALGTNPGGGTLSGGAPLNAVNGVATFSGLRIDKAGIGYTLRGTASGLTAGTSNAFNVTALPNQPPVAAFTSSCNGLSCSFTSTSSDPDGSIASYAWTFGDNGTATTQNPSHTYTAGGTFTVTLTVTDNQSATNNVSHTVTVTAPPPVNQPPVAAFTSSCSGLSCSFTSASSDPDGTIASYAWTFGDNGTAT